MAHDVIDKPESCFAEIFRIARLRYRAEQCRRISEDLPHDEPRNVLLRLAKTFDDLADEIERHGSAGNH